MAHNEEVVEILKEWQQMRFRDTEIPFNDVAASIISSNPIIEARRQPGMYTHWVLVNKSTQKLAVFTHAAVWSWGHPLDTGNFVPQGHEPPDGLPENKIENSVGWKCDLTYAFDTAADASIWDNIRELETFMCLNPKFNTAKRVRRPWQNAHNPHTARYKYQIKSKIFTRRTPHNSRDGEMFNVPYEVHPWIKDALSADKDNNYIPNPNKPQYFDFTTARLANLQDTNEPEFIQNDIVWMSFTVSFFVGNDHWWSEIVPLELVRVGKLPESDSAADHSSYIGVGPDFTPLVAGTPITFIERPFTLGKRNEPGSDDAESQMEDHESLSRKHGKYDDAVMADAFHGGEEELRKGNRKPRSTKGKDKTSPRI